MSQEVTVSPAHALAVAIRDGILVPRVIADAGDAAARRFLGFFAATIRNKNTRSAYYRAAEQFFVWCDRHRIGELADIEPLHVAAYIEGLEITTKTRGRQPQPSRRSSSTWPRFVCCSIGW